MRFLAKREQIEAEQMSELRIGEWIPEDQSVDSALQDDVLRLIFTCCHPALPEGSPRRFDATHHLRTDDRGNPAEAFLVTEKDHGAAAGTREDENPRRRHPL